MTDYDHHINNVLSDTENLIVAAALGERVTLSQEQVKRLSLVLTDYCENLYLVCPLQHQSTFNYEDDENE